MRELNVLYNTSKIILSNLEIDAVLQQILRVVHEYFQLNNCAILLLDEATGELYIHAAEGYIPEVVKTRRIKVGEEGITGWVAAHQEALYIPDVSKDPRYIVGVERARSELAIPLIIRDQLVGVLDLESAEVNAFDEEIIHILKLFADWAAIAIENARLFEKIKFLANTDGLTGLFNHRYFQSSLEYEIERVNRYASFCTLLMIDIDFFKEVNDRFGHAIGDEVLKQAAHRMKRQLRQLDIVARYGGEEFAIILTGTGRDAAEFVAKKIHASFDSAPLALPNTSQRIPLKVSVGAAVYPLHASSRDELIRRADAALYIAKASGRNRYVFYDTIEAPDIET